MVNMTGISEVVTNSTIFSKVSGDLSSGVGTLMFVLKVVGVLFIVYILFLIVRVIFDIIRNRRIKKIYHKVNEIDEKLDKLLERFPDKKKDKKLK
jgi:hypothetical protein